MRKVIVTILAILIVVGGGGYLLATQADAAAPGDTLYPIDTLAESVQRLLTFDDLKKAELETVILDERVAELESVMNSEDVDLTEVLAAISAQQDRVRDRIGDLETDGEQYQNGELEQIRNRYEEQLQQHIQVMQQVQNKGEDSALQIKEQLEEDLQNCQSGNCNVKEDSTTGNSDNGNGNAPDDTGNQSGNEDAGSGSDNGNGSSGSNGQGGNPNN